ncbi:MAG: hypothetical protein EBQ96_03145 [Proteobacteria bacterium]|nr:hypothetical protein [Pseudomonadota bacterium]
MTTIQPPLPPAPPQAQTQPPAEGEVVSAQVVKLPENLTATDRAITLKGEVIAQNPDGTVRIATPRGPIDVKLPEGQTVQRGQTVEVQIPAGTPPRTVNVTLPQLPPDTPRLPQQPAATPLPTVNQPQQPLPNANPPAVTVTTPISQPIVMPPAQKTGIPQTAQPLNTQAPQTQPQISAPISEAPVSPKGLLEFLKTSLQSALKTANTPETPPQPAPVFTQKPLVIGQLVRLTPVLSGQPVLTMPQNTPQPSLAFSQAASAQTQNTFQITGTPSALIFPGADVPLNAPPLQTSLATILGIKTNLGMPLNSVPDTLTRQLLPLLASPETPVAGISQGTIKPVMVTIQNAAPALAPVLSKGTETPLHLTPLPHQQAITVPALAQGHQTVPATDVRVTALLPTAPMISVQNPQMATLLHGTSTSPVMFATVAGQTPQGLPVLELSTMTTMPDGTQKPAQALMVLQFPARGLAPATVLRLDVLPATQPLAATPASAPASLSLATSQAWASLDDALGILHSEPQGQTTLPLLQAALPKPGGAAFTAPVLMFVAALRGGDITQWLGEKTTDMLRTIKRGEALTRITSDFSTQSRENADAPKGEWKSLTLPMIYGQEISRIALHSRTFERDAEGSPGQKKSGTRFVMDVNLTRMGDLQIDGLSIDKKLDVTLRTEKPLSPAMRENVRARYANALEGIGFAGQLFFNASPERKGWVDFEGPQNQRTTRA